MKRKSNMWKHITMWLAVIMVVSMVACSSDTSSEREISSTMERPSDTTTVEESTPAVEEPEVTEAEVREPEVIEVPEPVVDEDNPNVIDGIDFTRYNNGSEWLYNSVFTMKYDSLRILVIGDYHADAILKDGDTFNINKEKNFYVYYVYVPNEAKSITITSDDHISIYASTLDIVVEEDEQFSKMMPYMFNVTSDITETGIELPITVTYTDGTEETMTVTLYAE